MSGSDARALSRSLLDLCRMRKLTVATAESCTGGLVAGAGCIARGGIHSDRGVVVAGRVIEQGVGPGTGVAVDGRILRNLLARRGVPLDISLRDVG